jgi:prolyl oligopeptidase
MYYHRVGTSQESDVLIHKNDLKPDWSFSIQVTQDQKYLILSVTKGTLPKDLIFYADFTLPENKALDKMI